MGRTWALGDLLATLFERRSTPAAAKGAEPLPKLCRALLSGRGEVSGMKLAAAVLARWVDGNLRGRRDPIVDQLARAGKTRRRPHRFL